jgi:hypothetical protein
VRCGYDEAEAETSCSCPAMPNRSASALGGGAIVSRAGDGSEGCGSSSFQQPWPDPRWEIRGLGAGCVWNPPRLLRASRSFLPGRVAISPPRRPSLRLRPRERERGAVGDDVVVSDQDVPADIGHGAVPAQGPDPRNNRRRSNLLPPLLCHPVLFLNSLSSHNALTAALNQSSMNSIRIRPAPPCLEGDL